MKKAKQLDTNTKYNKLRPIEFDKIKNGNHYWKFKCECGNIKSISKTKVIHGKQKSCGCQQNPKIHGYSRTRTYEIWKRMRQRCNNPNSSNTETHYNRGIKVCDRWNKFENFLEDMGKVPKGDFSIERINNNGNYELLNCKWATRKEQNNNRRSNKILIFQGDSKTLRQWCDKLNLNYRTIQNRINSYGWSIEKALTTPIRKINRN